MKQMYQNGLSIGKLTDINIDIISLRHFVPLLFVCALILGFILSFLFTPITYLFTGLMGVYLLLDIVASIIASWGKKTIYIPILTAFFPLVHISYGWGTLKAIIKSTKRRFGFFGLFIVPFHIINLTKGLLFLKKTD